MAHSINLAKDNNEDPQADTPDDDVHAIDDQSLDPDECGFLISEHSLYHTSETGHSTCKLLYDSGASRSTVCNLSLLQDPRPISKLLNTYGGSVKVTHVGKLDIGGTIISPVFYAPGGPRNLVSATQLEDRGLKVVHKHCTVLVKLADQIVYRFPRIGNLYIFFHKPRTELNMVRLAATDVD